MSFTDIRESAVNYVKDVVDFVEPAVNCVKKVVKEFKKPELWLLAPLLAVAVKLELSALKLAGSMIRERNPKHWIAAGVITAVAWLFRSASEERHKIAEEQDKEDCYHTESQRIDQETCVETIDRETRVETIDRETCVETISLNFQYMGTIVANYLPSFFASSGAKQGNELSEEDQAWSRSRGKCRKSYVC
jgi:hypothetical protein